MNLSGSVRRWLRVGVILIGCGFLAIAAVCFLLVFLMAWTGAPWARVIYAEKPLPHLLGGLGALFAAYVLLAGYRNSRAQWFRFAGLTVLASVSLTVSLLAAEIALRAWHSAGAKANSFDRLKAARREGKPLPVRSSHPLAAIIEPSDDPAVVYELQPNLDMKFGRRSLRTNAQGLRESRDYPLGKAANCFRIVGIGDSGMFGWNIDQDGDYLSVLETNLNRRADGRTYDVINLAVPGYNTQLEVARFRQRGLAFQPDLVIVGWCENDFSLPLFLLQREDYRRLDKSFLFDLLFRRALAFPEVGKGITLHDLREYEATKVLPELVTGTEAAGVRAALLDLQELGRWHGFRVVVFGPTREPVRKLCKAIGLPFISTYDLIPDDKYPKNYNVHFMHPSADGHRVLAEALEQELRRRGWLPGDSPAPTAGPSRGQR